MKKQTHPLMRKVAFQDMVTGQIHLIDSTAETSETIHLAGSDYPLVKVEVSSSSHKAFNGDLTVEPTSTRREAFEKKYAIH